MQGHLNGKVEVTQVGIKLKIQQYVLFCIKVISDVFDKRKDFNFQSHQHRKFQ